jgi:two-component system, cell cycle sensor histidine kinase and response regulator CckA
LGARLDCNTERARQRWNIRAGTEKYSKLGPLRWGLWLSKPGAERGPQERFRVLSNATRSFAEASHSTDRLLHTVVREIASGIECSCALNLLTEDGDHFGMPQQQGKDPAADYALDALFVASGQRTDAPPGMRRALQAGKPFFVPHLALDLLHGAHAEVEARAQAMAVTSALVLPLRQQNQLVGALELTRRGIAAPPLDEHDVSLAQSLAEHAGLALATARLLEQTARDLQERERMSTHLRLLADAAHDFSEATVDYARLLVIIARRLGEALGDLCALSTVTEDGLWLGPGEIYHRDPDTVAWIRRLTEGASQRVGEGVTGRVAASREPVFMPQLPEHAFAASVPAEYRAFAEGLDVRSMLAVPMICRDQVVGVAMLLRSGPDKPYTDNDLQLLRSVVHHASIAIANARSYAAERAARAAATSANEALHRSEEAHRLLFDASPLPLLVFDVDTLDVLAVNDAALGLYGYEREEFMLAKVSVLTNESDVSLRARVSTLPNQALTGVARHRRKDGTPVVAEFTTRPFSFGGHGARILVLHDITAREAAEATLKLTEEQLRQSQKMDAVGRLAGGIAHDFNNLLSVILSYSDLIASDLSPSDPVGADVAEIRKAALTAADLTRQLLVFTRQQVVAPQVLDLNGVLSAMDKMLKRILGEDVDLVTRLDPGTSLVRVDPSSVEQVVMNLVVNARDAMPTGGQLTIETSHVELDEEYIRHHLGSSPGPHVMLAVSDTGAGMDRATQARIFEPFFTTKGIGKGTGLGLSTVFGIAQQAGGSVWVYSEPSKGTTFKVYFPRIDAEVALIQPSAPPVTFRGSETILLVEDQEQVRNVALSILRRHGYRVLVAQSAPEALALCDLESGAIDLLLTDVVMPHLSGAELAKRIAHSRPEIKVLCMSGYTDDSVIRHGVLQSDMPFLQKPFTPETLVHKVREVLMTAR